MLDTSVNKNVNVFVPVLCVIGDNPRASFLSIHLISAQAKQYVQGKIIEIYGLKCYKFIQNI